VNNCRRDKWQNKLFILTVLVGKKPELGVGKLLVFVLAVRSHKISRAGVDGSGGASVEAVAGLGSLEPRVAQIRCPGGCQGRGGNTASGPAMGAEFIGANSEVAVPGAAPCQPLSTCVLAHRDQR